MKYISPLRYPGGKRRVTGFMRRLVERNGLLGGTYMEPFAGGASVAWGLLFGEYVWRVVLNDISRPIYAFWHAVVHLTDELCGRIKSVEVTTEEWERQRSVQSDEGGRPP